MRLLFSSFMTATTICALVSFPLNARAGISIVSSRTVTRPTDANCKATNTCSLKEVKFVENKELYRFDGETMNFASHFTDTRFAFTVDQPADLESYGVVQFIHGCMFRTRVAADGTVSKELSISRDEFGQIVPFVHKTWEIDNDNDDPLISSYVGYGRFALLRWNSDPKSLDKETATYYGTAKPPHGSVFLSDLPSSGALMPPGNLADNTSLEFRTCIFKISDLPLHTDPKGSNIDQSKALWCASWDHKYIWNYATSTMDSPQAIDPICGATN